jgi:hypothetical protein
LSRTSSLQVEVDSIVLQDAIFSVRHMHFDII